MGLARNCECRERDDYWECANCRAQERSRVLPSPLPHSFPVHCTNTVLQSPSFSFGSFAGSVTAFSYDRRCSLFIFVLWLDNGANCYCEIGWCSAFQAFLIENRGAGTPIATRRSQCMCRSNSSQNSVTKRMGRPHQSVHGWNEMLLGPMIGYMSTEYNWYNLSCSHGGWRENTPFQEIANASLSTYSY